MDSLTEYFQSYLTALETYNVVGALWVNIQLTFWSALCSLVLGTVLALMRISPVPSFRWAGTAYVNIFRNTPLTIIMVFCILVAIFQLQLNLSSDFNFNFFLWAIVGLSVYHAAFVCESIRSGVNTVPLGQAEAARAIGLSFLPAARLVILPQAFRGAVAPLGNTLIALTKNTTVATVASVPEAAGLMKTMIEFRPDVIMAIFATFALGFVIIVIPIGLVTTWLSNKLAVAR
ncbi:MULTISPECIES: amino acid ABC transporter permease [Crystallibacter]|uniref:amino acid ABC transporter permease n=1 Tax=Crystallibacter TaxID=3456524 RepID=UPI0014758E19|nr:MULTISPECIES: amino acid ABC transporter permease [unclassified Arthrobacter]MCW2132835.1 glutamate transport system permease protein [Arthrobacter sp. VKM Ac-2550]NMR29824.1 amino acid ABC transporter permease [Arthrobacter sp. SF27]